MPDLLQLAQRAGVRKGLRGGSQVWTAIAVAAFGARQLRRLSQRRPTVLCEELEPGQSILITHIDRPRG